MIRLIAMLSLAVCGAAVQAETVLREISWQQALADGEIVQAEGLKAKVDGDALVVVKDEPGPATVPLLAIGDLGISAKRYAISGQVRYEDVEDAGYLEMWSCFGEDERYFSRALADDGPMQKLAGSSDWRPFVLPFYITKANTPPPTELLVNVHLPGRGTVALSSVRLVEYAGGGDPLAPPGQWWGDRSAGLGFGTLGALLGCLGGGIGVLASKGKARNVAFAMLRAMQLIGVACLVLGVVAVFVGQPYAVYYPLLLIGILCPALGMGLTPTLRKRYDEYELRKMSALDAV